MADKSRKSRKEEREEKKEIRKELKRKQETVLQNLAQLMEDVNRTVDIDVDEIDEIEEFSGFVQEESTVAGRAMSELMYRFMNDLEIGKKIKMGELRKQYDKVELEWKAPTWMAWVFSVQEVIVTTLSSLEKPLSSASVGQPTLAA